MDATSLTTLLNTWASLNNDQPPATAPYHCPITVDSIDDPSFEYKELKQKPLLWHTLGLDYRPRDASAALLARNLEIGPTTTRLFHVSRDQLRALKELCTRHLSTTTVSTNSALSALLWRCIVRARTPEVTPEAPTSLMSAVNIRASLPRPTTGSEISNAVIYSINNDTVHNLSASGPESLARAAKHISSAMTACREDATHINQTLALAAKIPDVSNLGLVYPTWLRNDVVISSLMHLPVYQQSWGRAHLGDGDGRPDFVRFPDGMFEGIVFVMPRKGDGSVEVVVTMELDHMTNLLEDPEMREYAQVVADPGKAARNS
jgi:hypothetical protein